MNVFGSIILFLIVLMIPGFVIIASNNPRPRDSTDSQTERSQLHLRTDAMTGCQYLESDRGSLTPRLDREGKQICLENSQ